MTFYVLLLLKEELVVDEILEKKVSCCHQRLAKNHGQILVRSCSTEARDQIN